MKLTYLQFRLRMCRKFHIFSVYEQKKTLEVEETSHERKKNSCPAEASEQGGKSAKAASEQGGKSAKINDSLKANSLCEGIPKSEKFAAASGKGEKSATASCRHKKK